MSAHPAAMTVDHDRLTRIKLFRRIAMRIACAAFALSLAAFPALAQNVKITPIGSHPGEMCANDRAIIFEDPTGVRFLYDAGPTVTGGNDARLGPIHLALLPQTRARGEEPRSWARPAVGPLFFKKGCPLFAAAAKSQWTFAPA